MSSIKDHNEIVDPWCDPDHPVKVTFNEVQDAAEKIKDGIQKTPCTWSNLSLACGMDIHFKKEFLHPTSSFKERGARYTLKMLTDELKQAGVIAASAGNHALAMAYHGKDLKIPVTVVMPTVAPLVKVQRCRDHGANVILNGSNVNEARLHAMTLVPKHNMMYINGYDHPHIIAGQGTMGLEICEQVPDLDAVIIPVGGGGMIAGAAVAIKHLRPDVKVYGVESEKSTGFSESLAAGKRTFSEVSSTIADGLSVPLVGVNAFETAAPLLDKVVVVKEEFIALAILRLIEVEKAVVEGAGASGLAAILAGLLPELKGKKVVVVLSGGNIDSSVLARVIDRGLAIDKRLCSFEVVVSDRPGGIAELTQLISQQGANLTGLSQERTWLKNDIHCVKVECTVETRNKEHSDELERALRSKFPSVTAKNSTTST